MSENRTKKYLLYAIGEIILVVIGILIALQINNWNDNRKNKIDEQNFHHNVLIDLQKDEEKLKYYKHFHTKRIEYLDTLLTYVRNPKMIMGIEKFGKFVEPIFYTTNPTSYSTTFDSAKSSGAFNEFKQKDLLKELAQYYADFVLIENTFESLTRFVESQYEPFMYQLPENYMTAETGNLVINEENVDAFYQKIASVEDTRDISADYNVLLRAPKMENYIIGDLGRSFNILGKINSRLQAARRLVHKIELND
ncbi:DUF6090 family protein [Winogradskyella ursingii]|uniref:DUF6090 family protein n=1 Tax=Winogradskyella ursingii TaxID=2686079 RepID=UPI0015CE69F4|nr:DUF6090 family protein [Winogradskyella ursingii]